MAEQVEHDGRHFFTVLEHLGSEADRLGIRAVDSYGKPGSVSDFLDTMMRYIVAREAERLRDEIRCATLTEEEREAIEAADAYMSAAGCRNTNVQDTLRGLLERTNHDAVPEAIAESDEARTDKAATSHRRDGTGDTPSEAEIDALEFVVVMGRVANGWDKDILRQWLIRLRPEFDSAKAIKEGESDRSQPIGSPAKTNPTQPRNGTPAEGSVQEEGSVPSSRLENEPVAWAVWSVTEGYDCSFGDRTDADDWRADLMADTGAEYVVVPLYRHPAEPCPYVTGKTTRYCTLTPFTLTDAEREALRTVIGGFGMWVAQNALTDDESLRLAVVTLRNLLARLT